jgi:hypothetical protein
MGEASCLRRFYLGAFISHFEPNVRVHNVSHSKYGYLLCFYATHLLLEQINMNNVTD